MILATHGFLASSIGQFDADAVAFFNRVTTAGGTLSATERNAVNTLVIQMKTDGIWAKMKAIYPMVGASAAACAQNLKSSSFTGSFTSGWTFSSTGVKGNGTSAYMDTGIIPSINLNISSGHMCVYSRTNITDSSADMGCVSSATTEQLLLSSFTGVGAAFVYGTYNGGQTNNDSTGLFITNRNSTTNTTGFRNSTKLRDSAQSAGLATNSLVIAAQRTSLGFQRYSVREYAFASIGDGLTDTQASNFYTAVQAFQTTLSRNV